MVREALGCKICAEGAKLVLFVTGICKKRCFYCPISSKRKKKDVVYANECRVEKDEDILEEAFKMNALGTGITGGEPLLFLDRTAHFMDLLKEELGERHHIHLYTTEKVSEEVAEELHSQGLDEIRFHLVGRVSGYKESLQNTREAGISTGVELPAIPGYENKIVEAIEKLDMEFLNLNELEFSETNGEALSRRGFDTLDGIRAIGSEELAMKIVDGYGERIPINFCSAGFKDGVQLRKRLLRTAHNIAKRYERVTADGTIVRGVVELVNPNSNSITKLVKMLKGGNYEVRGEIIFINPETLVKISKRLPKGVKAYISEFYPTWDELEVEREVLKE